MMGGFVGMLGFHQGRETFDHDRKICDRFRRTSSNVLTAVFNDFPEGLILLPGSQDQFVETGFTDAASGVIDDALQRSDERRVGKECGGTCRSRWSPSH